MARRTILGLILVVVIAAGVAWLLTAPRPLDASVLPQRAGDPVKGALVFWAGGCTSCHAAPGSQGDDKLKLPGGLAMPTAFGTFYVPNISPDKEYGIGAWSTLDFVNALKRGIGRDRAHLYPAFPYTSYQRMTIDDLVDLKAYLDTLPAVATPSRPHDLNFPFSIRRGMGAWKLLYLDGKTFVPDPSKSDEINRGAYLVNGPGHCNECHTPRNLIGGLDMSHALSGAPNPTGKGRAPNITSGNPDIHDWSKDDIANMLKTGSKPDFSDSLGGTMVEVQQNLAHLPDSDLAAIAAYLKAVTPQQSAAKADAGS